MITDDPNDPNLRETNEKGMQKAYLVLVADDDQMAKLGPLITAAIATARKGARAAGATS